MKTAAQLAQAAMQIGNISVLMAPESGDPYTDQRKLIQYHLQSAARLTRHLAEDTAAKEKLK